MQLTDTITGSNMLPIVKQVKNIIGTVIARDATTLFIEQIARVVLKIADHNDVIEAGRTPLTGIASGRLKDSHVIDVYLGV